MNTNTPYWIESPFNLHFNNSINLLQKTALSSENDNEIDENMYSIQTILNTVITIEAIGNCLIDDLTLPKRLKEEVDKFKILSKFEFYLQSKGQLNLDYGLDKVQKIKELISMRNDLVHSKVKKINGTMTTKEGEENVAQFFQAPKDKYNNTQIVKSFSSWGLVEAKIAVDSFLNFVNYIFNSLSYNTEQTSIILLPKQYDSEGIGMWMIDGHLDDSFKILNEVFKSEITPFIKLKGIGTYTELYK